MDIEDTLGVVLRFAIYYYEDYARTRRVCRQWRAVAKSAHAANVLCNPLSLGGLDSEVFIRRDLHGAVSMIERLVREGVEQQMQKPRQKRCKVLRLDTTTNHLGSGRAATVARTILGGKRSSNKTLVELFTGYSDCGSIDLHRDPGAVTILGPIRKCDKDSATVPPMVARFFATLKERITCGLADAELMGVLTQHEPRRFVFRVKSSVRGSEIYQWDKYRAAVEFLGLSFTKSITVTRDGRLSAGKESHVGCFVTIPDSHFKDAAAVAAMHHYCASRPSVRLQNSWTTFWSLFSLVTAN